jgi:hypothetical protein
VDLTLSEKTCALSLLMRWSLLESSVIQPELWDYWPWYRQKDIISISDMFRQLKAKSIERTIFITLSPDGHKVKKNSDPRKYFKIGCLTNSQPSKKVQN